MKGLDQERIQTTRQKLPYRVDTILVKSGRFVSMKAPVL